MGHRNTQFSSHMIDSETDQHGRSHLNPEPCTFYGTITNFPQPNIHTIVPAPGNACNFGFQPMPEHRGTGFFYGMTHHSGIQHHHTGPNAELNVAAPSGHYSPYIQPPSGIREFPLPVNHGGHDQLSHPSTQRFVAVPTDSYGRNTPSYMDCVRGSFKRKTAEGVPGIYQYHNASAGPSSSVMPMTVRPDETDVTPMDTSAFRPAEYGRNDLAPVVEGGAQRTVRNRPGMVAPEPVLAHNASHLIQGDYVAQQVQFPGNPWPDMHFSSNNCDNGNFTWTQAPIPYLHGSMNGPCMEAGNMGMQGYQVASSNRSSTTFMQPPIPQGHPNLHHPLPSPMQGVRGYNVNIPSQVAASSHGISTVNPLNTGINLFHDVVDTGPALLPPVLPTGFRVYRPHWREIILDPNARHRNFPHLRVLPEDEVAMLEIPGYHDAGDFVDQHRDMRLDIDHMSYEELLALGEQIGSVGTGLSEESIQNSLKVRTFTSSTPHSCLEEAAWTDQEVNFCVICQTEYEDQDSIGTLKCGHEYHGDCIKKWLAMKNSCPICKSTALTDKRKER